MPTTSEEVLYAVQGKYGNAAPFKTTQKQSGLTRAMLKPTTTGQACSTRTKASTIGPSKTTTEAIKLAPNDANAYYFRGTCLRGLRR